MSNIKIYVDSCSSITKELIDKYNITVIPNYFYLNEKEANPVSIESIDEFCEILDGDNKLKTSCINQYNFQEAFAKDLNLGNKILYISLSSGLSSNYQNAIIAKDNNENIAVFDSKTGSVGILIYLFKAIELINNNSDLNDIISKLNNVHISSHFTIGSLDHLYKGGRLSKSEAIVGNILRLKPIVSANEIGKLKITGIHLGKRKAIDGLYKLFMNEHINNDVYIAYTNNKDELEILKNKLLKENSNLNIYAFQIDPTMLCHCGPKTIAIFYEIK